MSKLVKEYTTNSQYTYPWAQVSP